MILERIQEKSSQLKMMTFKLNPKSTGFPNGSAVQNLPARTLV